VGKRTIQSGQRTRDFGGGAELELAVNQIAADQVAVRIVLQSFLLRLFALRTETAPAAFSELQDHVLKSIKAITLASEDQIGGARWKKLVAASAGQLFDEIADAADLPARGGALRQ